MEQRLQTAEEEIAHLVRTVEELSDQLARQAREIDIMSKRLTLLMNRMAEQEADQGNSVPLADQRPPHW